VVQQRSRAIGVSIDGYAVEGGYDTDDGPATSFGAAQALGMVRRSLGSKGTFDHLSELVERIADVGANEVRLTMEWARLEPRPGELDHDAFAAYDRALRAAARRGLSAVVVLCDAAWPSWLGQEPWLSTWAPVRFASHAASVGARLDGQVRALVTFRAPNAAARRGWFEGTCPPFRRRAGADESSALDGTLLAHQLAAEALAECAPTMIRAILFEASWEYGGESVFRDLAAGADARSRNESEARWRSLAAPHASTSRRGRRARGHHDVTSMRSTPRWASTPPCEWWVGSDDLALLGTTLAHSRGGVTTVELGARPVGWTSQLPRAVGPLRDASTVHLHGALSSTGPLDGPTGLLSVDQHGGGWTLSDPTPDLIDAIAGLGS
jgi:hypothetical protein